MSERNRLSMLTLGFYPCRHKDGTDTQAKPVDEGWCFVMFDETRTVKNRHGSGTHDDECSVPHRVEQEDFERDYTWDEDWRQVAETQIEILRVRYKGTPRKGQS